MSKLTPRQRKFAKYHYEGLSGRQAYLKAGYSSEGSTADVNASKLLKNSKVQEYIKKLEDKAMDKLEVNKEWLFERYKALHDMHIMGTPAVSKGSLDSIAKMFGLNEPDKVDVTTKGDKISSIDMGALSEETLQEIANAPKSSD